MAVRTDDGRSVSFDLKDYAHIDHGYAATFHKSQGVRKDDERDRDRTNDRDRDRGGPGR